MSSTRTDKNYRSWDGGGDDPPKSNQVLDPIGAGWPRGSWQDTAKFHAQACLLFVEFRIVDGGTEDGVDINNGCNSNTFARFTVAAGDERVLTLKGNSNRNRLVGWHVTKRGRRVEVEIGNWSSYNRGRSKGNILEDWTIFDGGPVRYAYRLGCRPTIINTNAKCDWLWCLALTAYYAFKLVKHDVLKVPDAAKPQGAA